MPHTIASQKIPLFFLKPKSGTFLYKYLTPTWVIECSPFFASDNLILFLPNVVSL
jgi:hypothetical protein